MASVADKLPKWFGRGAKRALRETTQRRIALAAPGAPGAQFLDGVPEQHGLMATDGDGGSEGGRLITSTGRPEGFDDCSAPDGGNPP